MRDEDAAKERPARSVALEVVQRGLVVALTLSVTASVVKLAARRTRGASAPAALRPFTKRYDGHVLTAAQASQLEAGQKVLLSGREINAGGGRGTAVCDVAAPPAIVWRTLLAFERYPGRLSQCKDAKVYDRRKLSLTAESIKVHMTLDGVMKEFNCYYDHTYRADKSLLTWTLDPTQKSDFVDVQGQWCVDKHPHKPNWSRVWYSADVALPPWLPRFVVVQLCKTGGAKALAFCKADAEARYAEADARPRFPSFSARFPRLASAAAKTATT
mmetsp:Transcript_6337/g.19212  ORF Transcript_6337/g.19212 Transcript_6337/m.19212 type:complete len:272 (-) Transcript_6337:106-921(-)